MKSSAIQIFDDALLEHLLHCVAFTFVCVCVTLICTMTLFFFKISFVHLFFCWHSICFVQCTARFLTNLSILGFWRLKIVFENTRSYMHARTQITHTHTQPVLCFCVSTSRVSSFRWTCYRYPPIKGCNQSVCIWVFLPIHVQIFFFLHEFV